MIHFDPYSCLAIDPDMRTPAFACVQLFDGVWKLLYAGVGRVKREEKELRRQGEYPMRATSALASALASISLRSFSPVLVEGQQIYLGVKQQPNDLLHLAQCAGAALGFLQAHGHWTYMPRPAEWKGSIPKEVTQIRAYKKLGWDYEKRKDYAIPIGVDVPGVNPGDWKHLGDAVALAVWGLETQPWLSASRATKG